MTRYDLYVEHGPMRKKTFVHVPGLMGCIAQGPTTDEALDAVPDAVRAYARFLAEHGERIDPAAAFTTRVVEETTEGVFLGNGAVIIADDRKPLASNEVEPLLARYAWIREDTIAIVADLTPAALRRKPASARSVQSILLHVLGAEAEYVSSGLGLDRELNKLGRDAAKGELDVREALAESGRRLEADVRAATPAQRKAVIPHGQRIGSARRTMRRSLEHGWEHFLEIRDRLG